MCVYRSSSSLHCKDTDLFYLSINHLIWSSQGISQTATVGRTSGTNIGTEQQFSTLVKDIDSSR